MDKQGMDQGLEGEEKKEQSLGEPLSDPVEDIHLWPIDFDVSEFGEEPDLPICESFGTGMATYKWTVWVLIILLLVVPFGFMQKSISDLPVFAAVCTIVVGGALVFSLVQDRSYVRLYKDRIEWRNWSRSMEAHEYSVRLDSIHGRILVQDLSGQLIGKLPQVLPVNLFEIVVSLHNMGKQISLPSTAVNASLAKGHYILESNPLKLTSMFIMLLPALGIFGALSLFLLPSVFSPLWPLALPLSILFALLLHKVTKNKVGRSRYEFSKERVSKIKAGQTVWTVELKDVKHLGLTGYGDDCKFALVTHYGRRYSLPGTWSVALPFAIYQNFKIVREEEVLAGLK